MRPRAAAAGFTVLEMMVVLIIISLALMLGFQSLEQWQRAEASLDRISATTRARALSASWWMDSVRSLTPVENQPFQGSADRLQGFSLSPVFASSGAMTPISWTIVDDPDHGKALQMEEDGTRHLLPLVDVSEARFRYLSRTGEASDRWPPGGLGLQDHTSLPAFVELLVRNEGGEEQVWMAHVVGPLDPFYRAFRLEDEF